MVDVKQILGMLNEHRQQLQRQLDAIDTTIAALAAGSVAPVADTSLAEPVTRAEAPANAAPSTRIKPRRVQSDAHKEAIIVGKRRARAAREAAKGLAREMPDDSFVPAIRVGGECQSPRLVKRPSKKQ